MNDESAGRIHWSFWAIGAIALIWNALGGINFLSQMNADALATMPESYRAIIESRPAWSTAAFAIAVFGGMLGCLLLLVRKLAAYYVFIASLVGAIVTIAQFQSMAGSSLPGATIGSLMQLLVAVFLIWYSRRALILGWIS